MSHGMQYLIAFGVGLLVILICAIVEAGSGKGDALLFLITCGFVFWEIYLHAS